jgi:hypothetical protein
MQLRQIMRLRRNSGGSVVEMELLHQFGLPMPELVMQDFLCDHGIKDHIVSQFGDLDLHTIGWELRRMPAEETCPFGRGQVPCCRSTTCLVRLKQLPHSLHRDWVRLFTLSLHLSRRV